MITIFDKDLGRVKINPYFVVALRLVKLDDGRGHQITIVFPKWKYDEVFVDGVKANLRLQEIEEAVDKVNGGSDES